MKRAFIFFIITLVLFCSCKSDKSDFYIDKKMVKQKNMLYPIVTIDKTQTYPDNQDIYIQNTTIINNKGDVISHIGDATFHYIGASPKNTKDNLSYYGINITDKDANTAYCLDFNGNPIDELDDLIVESEGTHEIKIVSMQNKDDAPLTGLFNFSTNSLVLPLKYTMIYRWENNGYLAIQGYGDGAGDLFDKNGDWIKQIEYDEWNSKLQELNNDDMSSVLDSQQQLWKQISPNFSNQYILNDVIELVGSKAQYVVLRNQDTNQVGLFSSDGDTVLGDIYKDIF